MTTPMETLRQKDADLKAEETSLAEQFRAWHDGTPDAARARDAIRQRLQGLRDERSLLSARICAAKERVRRERVEELLRSEPYRDSVLAAAAALDSMLGPWLPMVATCQAVPTAPALPPFVGTAYVEGIGWLRTMIRVGALATGDLPPALRSLVEGAKR